VEVGGETSRARYGTEKGSQAESRGSGVGVIPNRRVGRRLSVGSKPPAR